MADENRGSEAEQSRRIAAAIKALLRDRDEGKTICPSEAARAAGGNQWRKLMPLVRKVAWALADEGWLDVTRKGEPVDRDAKGPVRLRRRSREPGTPTRQ